MGPEGIGNLERSHGEFMAEKGLKSRILDFYPKALHFRKGV